MEAFDKAERVLSLGGNILSLPASKATKTSCKKSKAASVLSLPSQPKSSAKRKRSKADSSPHDVYRDASTKKDPDVAGSTLTLPGGTVMGHAEDCCSVDLNFDNQNAPAKNPQAKVAPRKRLVGKQRVQQMCAQHGVAAATSWTSPICKLEFSGRAAMVRAQRSAHVKSRHPEVSYNVLVQRPKILGSGCFALLEYLPQIGYPTNSYSR